MDAAALLGVYILNEIFSSRSLLESNVIQKPEPMTNRNYLFYIWVLRKLPSHLRSSRNFFFVINSIAACLFLIPMGILMTYLGNINVGSICVVAGALLLANLLMWRNGVSLLYTHAVFEVVLLASIIFSAAMNSGVTSTYIIFLGLVPMLPVFSMSRNWALGWVVVSVACLLGLYVCQLTGYLPVRPGDTWQDLSISTVCIFVLVVTQIILIYIYDSYNSQSLHLMSKTNKRLEKTSSALLLADSHKDKFLAMVSHDMRTPLNAVIGYLGLLHDNKNLPSESMGFVASAQHAAAHLLAVINDLLDFSQIRLGQLTLHPQVVNLPHVLTQTFNTLNNQAQEVQLAYALFIQPDVPKWVRIDQNRLSQILINLLGNALKFTSSGHVYMRVSVQHSPTHPIELVVDVEDTGIGMTGEQLARIFLPFTQVHDAQAALRISEPMRGNGLGLAITQSLVQSHQGQLLVKSTPGQGSIFTLRLPIEVAEEPANQAQPFNIAATQDLTPVHVLVVDDNNVNRLVVSTTLLRSFPNAVIEQAENGTEALAKMRTTLYELVLIDLVMPDIDGADVVNEIRRNAPEPFRSVPAIALTANVAQDAIERCRAAGVNEVLPKPFDRNTLIRAVRAYTVDKGVVPSIA